MTSRRTIVLAAVLPLLAAGAFLVGRLSGGGDVAETDARKARLEAREAAAPATNLVSELVAGGAAHQAARPPVRNGDLPPSASRAREAAERRDADRIRRRLVHVEREKERRARQESDETRQLREAYEKLRAQEETPALRQAREAYERQRDLDKAMRGSSHHHHHHRRRHEGAPAGQGAGR